MLAADKELKTKRGAKNELAICLICKKKELACDREILSEIRGILGT
jgi:hypothetical protein